MFDLKGLGDMSKIAGEAKRLQQEQQRTDSIKLELLKKISAQLDEVLAELRRNK